MNDSTEHLTYCLNIHAGETWADHLQAVRTHALAVRERVRPDRPFGLGLRLGAQAATELSAPGELEAFKEVLAEHDLYAFTINGFPYGPFHGRPVKAQVYEPDWTQPERRDYTCRLATLLAGLLPADMTGSISTVPGAFRTRVEKTTGPLRMAEHLMECVGHLVALQRSTGREIHLGLEPEPACFIETTDDFLHFYEDVLLGHGRQYLQDITGESRCTAEKWVRRHLGVCLDTCHAALQFENAAECIDRYEAAGVRLSKIQLSAALETDCTEAGLAALRPFDEAVYLHQTRARAGDGTIHSWTDLPDALAALPDHPAEETVRVHFHVPLFWPGQAPLRTTAVELDQAFWDRINAGACPHLEIETYTFDVLPDAVKPKSIDESIAREFEWVESQRG